MSNTAQILSKIRISNYGDFFEINNKFIFSFNNALYDKMQDKNEIEYVDEENKKTYSDLLTNYHFWEKFVLLKEYIEDSYFIVLFRTDNFLYFEGKKYECKFLVEEKITQKKNGVFVFQGATNLCFNWAVHVPNINIPNINIHLFGTYPNEQNQNLYPFDLLLSGALELRSIPLFFQSSWNS